MIVIWSEMIGDHDDLDLALYIPVLYIKISFIDKVNNPVNAAAEIIEEIAISARERKDQKWK